MSTPKEIFLEMLKPQGRAERALVQYEALSMIFPDPIMIYLSEGARIKGGTGIDRWGTTMIYPEDAPGAMPYITEENKVLKDITRWREFVHAPDIARECAHGWEQFAAMGAANAGTDKLNTAFMGTGIFEQCHFLMGFEDTLTNLVEHPDEMHELIDYITEYRLLYAKMLIDNLRPEAIFSHDDWGTKDALFMSPDMWREFFKEPYRKFYGYIRSRGVIAIHHADSYLSPIVEDMAEIGIEMWQGVLPENDIPELQRRLNGSMILMGGIGAAIDRADATEDEIRAYVRSALEQYCPGGHFIPSITYGLAGTIFPHVDPVIDSEIAAWNERVSIGAARGGETVVRRRARKTAERQPETERPAGSPVESIAEALLKGQKKKTVQLAEEALNSGIPASVILSDGLVRGMEKLGVEFSENRAFVPEMLMAARCMNAALELLKPHLASETSSVQGRVCLGTIRGDMHDIGKNLVKIMMEGCGLDVIDLGVDVAPEVFVSTATDMECDVIACSSLLTTSMDEMRQVVQLAKEAGIRDKVRIMVGGAPVDEAFCREIGADAYTVDAAEAARTAVAMLA